MLDCLRQRLNLKALKRAGRGHDPTGVDGTQEGTLVVECPACPQPGRNLPDDWQNAPAETVYVIQLTSVCYKLICLGGYTSFRS